MRRTLLFLVLAGCGTARDVAPEPPAASPVESIAAGVAYVPLPAAEQWTADDDPDAWKAQEAHEKTCVDYVERLRFGGGTMDFALDRVKATRAAWIAAPPAPPKPPIDVEVPVLTVTPGAPCATIRWGNSSVQMNFFDRSNGAVVPSRADVTANGGPTVSLRGDTATLPELDGVYVIAVVSYPDGALPVFWPPITVERKAGSWTTR